MGSATLIGVDVGGTFTDVVVWEVNSRKLWLEKVPTTPDAPPAAPWPESAPPSSAPGSPRAKWLR